jgi:hypothetical protein
MEEKQLVVEDDLGRADDEDKTGFVLNIEKWRYSNS